MHNIKEYIRRENGYIEDEIMRIISLNEANKLIFISGEYGIGKTTLLEFLNDNARDVLPMIFKLDFNNNTGTHFLVNIVSAFLETIGKDNSMPRLNDKLTMQDGFDLFNLILPDVSYTPIDGKISLNFRHFVPGIKKFFEDSFATFDSMVLDASKQYDTYVAKLVKIVEEVTKMCNDRQLLLIIDNIEQLDGQTAAFIALLNDRIKNIGLIITSESKLNELCNPTAASLLSQIVKSRTGKIEKRIDLSIPSFNNEDAKQYILTNSEISFKNGEDSSDILNNFVENAIHYSYGIPLFLSIICENLESLEEKQIENINFSQDYFISEYYNQKIANKTFEENEIVNCIAANDGSLHIEVFSSLFSNYVNAKRNLLNEGIIESSDDFYRIRIKLLVPYIRTEVRSFKVNEKEYSQTVLTAYRNLEDRIDHKYNLYTSLVSLACKVNNPEEVLKYAIKGSDVLVMNLKPDLAARIIDYGMEFGNLCSTDKTKLESQLVRILYLNKEMSRVIDTYEKLAVDENFETYEPDIKQRNILYAAKAHYYMNNCVGAISLLHDFHPDNSFLYYEAKILFISSLDLNGDYGECMREYEKAKEHSLSKDDGLIAMFDMVVQMNCVEYKECIESLSRAYQYFKDRKPRYSACCANNLGIEYLMNGEFDNALLYLEESLELFECYHPIELHFALNNLGIYYQYSVTNSDFVKAEKLFKEANIIAISPLQNLYTLLNLSILYFQTGRVNDAEKLFISGEYLLEKIPDPIAGAYFHYNYAKFLYEIGEVVGAKIHCAKSYTGIEKPQLAKLIDKRNRLSKSLGLALNANASSNEENTTRRDFFSKLEWEPCELMFYN